MPSQYNNFNPHTREGCDSSMMCCILWCPISIHTPAKGVTLNANHTKASMRNFNPHTREGCDVTRQLRFSLICDFNPHTREGCDSVPVLYPSISLNFNPHTREGCDHTHVIVATHTKISIHTPAKGVTLCPVISKGAVEFQSTHPRRV